jgi:hypothetical protein
LVVDTELDGPSVVYYKADSNFGVSMASNLIAGSIPLLLGVGQNNLVFTTSDVAPTLGTCEVMWAPTYPIGV